MYHKAPDLEFWLTFHCIKMSENSEMEFAESIPMLHSAIAYL